MAKIIEQINEAIEDRVVIVLGSTYKELPYVLDVSRNEFKDNNKRFGVRPLLADSNLTVTNTYTADQPFEIILTHGYVNKSSDKDQRSKMFILYDKVDALLKDIVNSKVGLNNIVLQISTFSILETEFLEDNLVIQRLQLTVQYRQAV